MDGLIQGILSGQAVCVTDGSYKDCLGTAAYTFLPSLQQDYTDAVTHVNHTPGEAREIDSFRAEAAGIYGCLMYGNALCKQYHLTEGTITLGCDCQAAINRIFCANRNPPSLAHYDIIQACRRAIEKSPLIWKPLYVQGHQDANTPYQSLDRWGQLNSDMDWLAKRHWQTVKTQNRPCFSLPDTDIIGVWHKGWRLTTWNDAYISRLIHEIPNRSYWTKKHCIEHRRHNWDSIHIAFNQLPITRQLWLNKWLTRRLPFGANLKKWKIHNHDLCPRCGQPEDNTFHTLRCMHPESTAIWQKSMNTLTHSLTTNFTHPDLIKGIVESLSTWRSGGTRYPLITSSWPGLTSAITKQQQYGIRHLFNGFVISDWIEVQQRYYQWLKRRNTGLRWAIRLITLCWEIAWDMWRHRMKIAHTTDSQVVIVNAAILDQAIICRFQQFQSLPDTPSAHLSRWFSSPIDTVTGENADFKQQWLEAVNAVWRFDYPD